MQLDMNLPALIQWFLFVFFIISVILYLAYFILFYRFRHEQRLNIPFYKLTLSLGVADLCRAFNSWFAIRIQWWGWIFGYFSAQHNETLPNFPISIAWFFQIAQVGGVILMSVERFSAVIWPFKHYSVWTTKRILFIIAFQWIAAFLLTIPLFDLRLTWQQTNESIKQIRVSNDSREFAHAYYILGNLFFLIVSFVFIPALYIILFYYGWQNVANHNRTTSFDHSQSSNSPSLDKNELKLSFCGFMISMTLLLPFIFAFLASTMEYYDSFYLLYCIALDYFNQSKPYIYLASSTLLRRRFLSQFCGAKTQNKKVVPDTQPDLEMDVPSLQSRPVGGSGDKENKSVALTSEETPSLRNQSA